VTVRRASMPSLSAADARWDAEAGKVCYFACFEGTDEWIEISAEDFDRLTRLFAQEAIDVVCEAISSTLEHVKDTLEEFSSFREQMEKLAKMSTSAAPEGAGN
jgi:hypothetical protein